MMDALVRNINQLNVTMQIMEANIGNYIASNDLTLKAMNESLQFVVKTPMVILVPSSDEIDDYRSKVTKITRNRSYYILRPN